MFSWRTKLSILRAILTKKSPYYIQFYINGVCHLQCRQCNIVEANSGIGELSLPEMDIVARNIREIGGGIVLLTGGEPFLRKDLDRIVEIFLGHGLDVRLQTAGIATHAQLQKCYDAGARDLNISLDSLDADKQDYINATPGSWRRAVQAIERVSRVFRGDSAICSLGCVLSRFNYQEIPAVLAFATRIGWYLSLVPCHITTMARFMAFRSYDDDFSFRREDFAKLQKVIERIIQMKRQGCLLFDSERFLWSAFHFLKTNEPTWRHQGVCDAPDLYFAVRPNGDFSTCCDYTLDRPPSLVDPDFPQKYRSGEIHRIARPVVTSCKGCHYGSYPEVTISVRNTKALWERIRIVLFQRRQIIKDLEEGELFQVIGDVKKDFPEVYARDWLAEDLRAKVDRWRDAEERRRLLREDRETRLAQGRRRRRPRGKSLH